LVTATATGVVTTRPDSRSRIFLGDLPDHLADRLEERRREEPVRITDRGIHYLSRCDVAGGTPWRRTIRTRPPLPITV